MSSPSQITLARRSIRRFYGPLAVLLILLLLATVGALTYACVETRGDLAQATEEIGAKNKQVEEAHSNLQQVEGERDGLEATVESLQAERDGLEATVETLQAERDGLEATVESLQAERDGLETTVESLQAERDGLETTVESLQAERDGLEETVESLQAKRNVLDATVESLRAERDGLEATVGSLRVERNGLEATVETLQTERDGLKATVASLQAERDGLETTVESVQAERDGLEASYAVLSDENSGLKATLQTLEEDKRSLETQVEQFKLAHESVTKLEERAEGLRAVIAGLEEDRKALQVKSIEMFPTCTGSMEPKITCLDTVVVLQNFLPEDIAVDTVISYYPPGQTAADGGSPVLHRVIDIKTEDDVHYFWPKGDALDAPDGVWVAEGNVLGYVIELRQGKRPENSALRERVNGARERYIATRGKMLEARDRYDDTAIRHCGSVAAVSSCSTSQGNLTELRAAYDAFSQAWGQYLNAVCEYDEAYYHGLHESEPSTGQMFDPYVAPSVCSQSS